MEAVQEAPVEEKETREKRTYYFVVKKVAVLSSKKEAEDYLTEKGGLKEDEIMVRGLEVSPEPKQVFTLG